MSCRPASNAPRRGLALVVVMAALATAVVIAVAFLHAQSSALRVAENGRASDFARQAAETGLAAALAELQSPSWGGIDTVLSAEVGRDGSGLWSYRVVSTSVASGGTTSVIDAAMRLKLTSVGSYLPAGSTRPVERTMEAVLQLTPRMPVSLSAVPSDRRPDAAWDPVQAYACFGGAAGDSLKLPPQAKIVGDAWVYDRARVYHELTWPAGVRQRIGQERPAPLAGTLTHYNSLGAEDAANLAALLGADKLVQTSTLLTLPAADFSNLAAGATYRIYQGGPIYSATAVSSTLDGTSWNPVTLGPTDANPLGIYYRSGDLRIEDNVRVTGTLVATGALEFRGPAVEIATVRPPAGSGSAGVAGSNVSLPAVICGGTVTIRREATLTVAGAIYAAQKVFREDVDRQTGTTVAVTGTVATGQLDLYTPPMWKALSAADWTNRSNACLPMTAAMLPWLANPGNWPLLSWPLDYTLYGLSNEPTFTVTRPADASYVLAPPLFRPDPSAWNAGGGYRWAVLAWREVTP